jgi:two-component flavin-dependent monooxygenase
MPDHTDSAALEAVRRPAPDERTADPDIKLDAEAAERTSALAARHTKEADAGRRLSLPVQRALIEAGFARHFVPAEHGGAGGSFSLLLDALVEVGKGCASAAWCGLIVASSGRIAAFLPERGRCEVWDSGADTAIATALAPAGDARRVDGGWRVSGEWGFVSHVDAAEWVFVCVRAPHEQGPQPLFCALHRGSYTIRDTWFTTGMRGTGSNTVAADGVFVPDHLTFPQSDLLTGTCRHPAGPTYTVPLLAAMPPLFAAPTLGAAFTALDAWVALMAGKSADGLPGESARLTLVRCTARLDAARLLLEEACRTTDAGVLTPDDVLRNARNAAMAADLTLTAVDELFRSAGTAAQAESSPLQRIWRDTHAATQHNVLRFQWSSGQLAEHVWQRDRS